MDTQQLKTFLTIAEVGSFTKASELLDYAQSSISAQIKSLEEEFNTRLFERMGRTVLLTDSGKKFVTYAEQFLKLTDDAKQTLSVTKEPQGTLIIGAPETLCVFLLPSLLSAYRSRYPKVKLILKQGGCKELYEWTEQNRIDVAFVIDRPETDRKLIIEAIRIEPTVMIAEANHPLCNQSQIKPEALVSEDFILVDECSCCYRAEFEQQLKVAGVQLNSFQEFGSVEMIKKTVASGLGLSLLPSVTVETEIKNGQLAALQWDTSDYNIYTLMVLHRDKWHSPALEALVSLVREQLRDPSIL